MSSMISQSASSRIPPLVAPLVSPRARKTLDDIQRFVEEDCIPSEPIYAASLGAIPAERFSRTPQILEDLKATARGRGLWNLFFPREYLEHDDGTDGARGLGAGFTNLEYGLMAEVLGRSSIAPEACNCNAPDTGNMEVLAKYGSKEQRRRWLVPLLEGRIRSAFLMTEPDKASSDAKTVGMSVEKAGGEFVLNGKKWWITNSGSPHCDVFLVVGKDDPNNSDPYKQQCVILVPADTPGISINRMLGVFGYDDAPSGHGEVEFVNVRVPQENIILGPGRGFEVLQGRLGPGRIHHAMRSIGAAERALEYFLARANDPSKRPFGKYLSEHGVQMDRIAQSRIDIDAARLVVCNAAVAIDASGAKGALAQIAEAKVLVPQTLLEVLDRTIQLYGAGGLSQDYPLASMYANGRTMRFVDGPDEVHREQLAKGENKRAKGVIGAIQAQEKKTAELFKFYNVKREDPLRLGRVRSQGKL